VQTDITDLRQAEDDLRRQRDKLAEAKRLSDIGVLAASVAHDLRGPLSVMNIATHNIKRKSRDSAIAGHIARIEKKVAESDRIITNLLRYVRTKDPVLERAGIYRVVLESVAGAIAGHPGQKVIVRRNLAGLKDIEIDIDAVQIKEVLDNLLNNAYDALVDRSGGVAGKIEVKGAVLGKSWVEITISDNGPGIDAQHLDRVFDPLFSTKTLGTGLGLTICKELVRRHHGLIDIQSREGEGTTIQTRLPLSGSWK
jgi:signal transduction histidine kinase